MNSSAHATASLDNPTQDHGRRENYVGERAGRMVVLTDLVLDGLAELADVSYQERVWRGNSDVEVSSLEECVERIFDDSGLGFALERGAVFDPEVDRQLRRLGDLIERVDATRPVGLVVRSPELALCREVSAAILKSGSLTRAPVTDD